MTDNQPQHADPVRRLVITPGQAKTLRNARNHETVGDDRGWWDAVRYGIRQYRAYRQASFDLDERDAKRAARNDGDDRG